MQIEKTKVALIQSAEYRKARGLRVKQARKKTGASIREFAELIGIAEKTLTGIERGEIEPKVKTLELAALHSAVDVGWLFFGDVIYIRQRAVAMDK